MESEGSSRSGDPSIDQMFASICFEARFDNHTSKTSVQDPTKVVVSEFGDRALILEVPARSVNTEHQITLHVSRVGVPADQRFTFSATGKILSVEQLGDDRIRVEFKMLQFDEASWLQYQELYAARQEEITQFLFSVNR